MKRYFLLFIIICFSFVFANFAESYDGSVHEKITENSYNIKGFEISAGSINYEDIDIELFLKKGSVDEDEDWPYDHAKFIGHQFNLLRIS